MTRTNNPIKPQVTIVGGGMITQIQLLPTVYQMQREGVVGEIHICALNTPPLAAIQDDKSLQRAFPGQSFTPHPDPATAKPDEKFPDMFRDVLSAAPKGGICVIALPDQLHYIALQAAIEFDQHICVVKPLVLKHSQAVEIETKAFAKGLVVGVEYHKRFDYRNLMAREAYRTGKLGEFRLAQAQMIEPYYYRNSNFQNWCTCENSDMFTYVGCHYVDIVAFITGLKPKSVSVYGIEDKYPNGNTGYLWTDGRVIWENGASLSVVDAMGYPNEAAGGNAQGMTMWCQGSKDATLLVHSDQYRGVKCHYEFKGDDLGDTLYAEPNPDYFQMIDQGGEGLVPVGYGHRSAEYIIKQGCWARELDSLEARQNFIKQLDADGIMATPANSNYNELVVEAGRLSILNNGREVEINYDNNTVDFKKY